MASRSGSRFVGELSCEEIAGRLDLPMDTLKVQRHRVRRLLQERLDWLGLRN